MADFEVIFWVEWCLRCVLAVVILLRKRKPTIVLAWLVVVAFLPFAGAALYLLIGENRLGMRRRRKYKALVRAMETFQQKQQERSRVYQPVIDPRFAGVAALAESAGAYPPLGGNQLELLSDTELLFDRMAADIAEARHHCHLLFYILNPDAIGQRIGRALMKAVERGVACRLLVDAVGSRDFLRSALAGEMHEAGVQVVAALPVTPLRALFWRIDLRNHRKIAVIDGRVAYTGSHNISTPIYPRKQKFGAWVDASVRLTGPAVMPLQEVFLQDWAFSAGPFPEDDTGYFPKLQVGKESLAVQVLPTGPEVEEPLLMQVMVHAVDVARKRVVLTTPYFVPDEPLLMALRSSAMRGVETALIVPHYSDHPIAQAAGRSHYGHLLDAGVRIHEYTPGLLHAKTLTVDYDLAMIGTANLDVRSFQLNFESALLIFDDDMASRIHFLQTEYLSQSVELSMTKWKKRGTGKVLLDNIAKLATPLL